MILDYRGVPYLRFSRSGVAVNHNSAMYYLNQTPAEVPPSNVGPARTPRWSSVSGGHEYSWHDGRLHALATVALAPGQAYVGRWSIPVRIDGHLAAISGGLWHAEDPSIVWFWPIVVLLACTLALWRVRRRGSRSARRRPGAWVRVVDRDRVCGRSRGICMDGPRCRCCQLITFAIIVAFVVGRFARCCFGVPGTSRTSRSRSSRSMGGCSAGADVAEWVRARGGAGVRRAVAAVVCLGCAAALLLFSFRLVDLQPDESDDGEEFEDEFDDEGDHAWPTGV